MVFHIMSPNHVLNFIIRSITQNDLFMPWGVTRPRVKWQTVRRRRSLRHEDSSPFEPTDPKIGKRLVGLIKPIRGSLRDNSHLWDQPQEINPILPREIRHRPNSSLFPKQPVGKAWNIAHVDAGTNDAASLANRL